MKVSKAALVANMMIDNPDATVKDVMKKFKVSQVYGYNLMSQARTKHLNRREEALKKPKQRMMSSERKEEQGVTLKQLIDAIEHTDNVNHPDHYRTGGIETIDFIEAKNLNYHLGNVVKYITRADHKGDRLENLKKAQWYLNREIEKSGK